MSQLRLAPVVNDQVLAKPQSILAMIRVTWIGWMQERSFFFLLAFGWMITPLVYLFVWSTAAGERTIGGLSRGEFVAYYLVLIVVNQLTYAQANWTLGDLIRDGKLNILLLRPIAPFYDVLATEIAGKGIFLLFVLPVTGALGLILQPEIAWSLFNVLAFIPALLLAWLLRFLWGYWLAMLAFWATQANALLAVQDALIFLLAGQVAPIAILPNYLRLAAELLPFRYMVGFPVEILTGQVNGMEMLYGISIQLAWVSVALLLCVTLWRVGLSRYSAVGG
ncbi:MAG: ABC-2 family transporter protein [Chloroflexota bacterium]